ncbi:MAG TPA: DUF4386 domain-containing protein [Candidatus Thermoplasmatota archaeon]|nr:DUF4386 domain-containing protein [Candidatus Thermoplasmatota archaeon]
MNIEKNAPRLLGAAFLLVVVTSLVGGLFSNAAGTGSISEILVNISNNLTLTRISIIGGLANSTGIVILAVLLNIVLRKQSKTVALVALGLWLAEAIFYAIMQLGPIALIPLSQEFVKAGSPAASFYQTLGDFLYTSLYSQGLMIHMWFYCVGGILWYSMFLKSRYVPRIISLFGVLAVLVGIVGIVLELFGFVVPMLVFIPIGLFEITIGLWLLLRGIKDGSEKQKGQETES